MSQITQRLAETEIFSIEVETPFWLPTSRVFNNMMSFLRSFKLRSEETQEGLPYPDRNSVDLDSIESWITRPENTICKERWYYADLHFGRGETKTCCLTPGQPLSEKDFQKYGIDAFMNHPEQLERRREKLLGIRHSDCNTCWQMEKSQAISKRKSAAHWISPQDEFAQYQNARGIPGNWEQVQKNQSLTALRVKAPKILDISLQNECNLMCTYCNFHYSSRWEKEMIRWGEIKEDQAKLLFNKTTPSYMKYYWEWFDSIKNDVEQILFIGGEPLIQPGFYEILEKTLGLLESAQRSKPIEIHITSNFNIPSFHWERFVAILPELTRKAIVKIECSTEAFGERAEYIRYGLKWKTLTKNVENLLSLHLPNLTFGFHACLTTLSSSSMIDLFRYTAGLEKRFDRPVNILENVVISPSRFSLLNLTPDFASYYFEAADFVKDNLKMDSRDRRNGYVNFLKAFGDSLKKNQGDPSSRPEFYRWLSRFDQKMGTDFLKTFPEYGKFWEVCREAAEKQ